MTIKLNCLVKTEEALHNLLGDRVVGKKSSMEQYARDESYHSSRLPDFVAFPKSTEEVSKIVEICAASNTPIIPWGAGTSLEGHILPVQGGLTLDMSQMNHILEVDSANFTATVEAGVRRIQLNTELRDTGLFFPVDPGADATIGGMIATRASGTNAVKYGTMKHNIISCTCVLANGHIIQTARHAPKSSAGYDLTALMVGSEGTLGIITEATVCLHPVPDQTTATVSQFSNIQDAVEAATAIRQIGMDIARIEFLDEYMMSAIISYDNVNFEPLPTLFVEFHGSQSAVEEQNILFKDIISSFGGAEIQTATKLEDRKAIWGTRHNALYASKALDKGREVLITDVCVPISRLVECITQTRQDLDASNMKSTIAGHVGDGNFHVFILIDPTKPDEIAQAEQIHKSMAQRAISMNGTSTGEHGIGIGKRDLLVEELGEAVDVMAKIKSALDPTNLFNPGKVFTDRIQTKFLKKSS